MPLILRFSIRGFDIVVVFLACHICGVEYVDVWRAIAVVAFSWLVSLLLLPLLILAQAAGPLALLAPWLGVLFSALAIFIAVKYVMMIDWDVAARIGAVFLVWKVLAQFLLMSLS